MAVKSVLTKLLLPVSAVESPKTRTAEYFFGWAAAAVLALKLKMIVHISNTMTMSCCTIAVVIISNCGCYAGFVDACLVFIM